MITPGEYAKLPNAKKRDFALAIDVMERMCAESSALLRRSQSALMGGIDGRAEADRCELVQMCKRNEIFARQLEYAMGGISIQIVTDDRGNPVRVRKPLGFVSLEALAAMAAAEAEDGEQ